MRYVHLELFMIQTVNLIAGSDAHALIKKHFHGRALCPYRDGYGPDMQLQHIQHITQGTLLRTDSVDHDDLGGGRLCVYVLLATYSKYA